MLIEHSTDRHIAKDVGPSMVAEGKFAAAGGMLFLLVALFLTCVLMACLRAAAKNPLWMDEVLAIWAARLPSAVAIRSALEHGSEFSPPTYHLLLHYLARMAGGSYLVYRLPSVAGHLITGICVFTLLRRYLDTASAAFGMVFALLGYVSMYALQARPYGLLVACFAMATLLWNDLDSKDESAWRIGAVTLLLVLSAALHFYAALFVCCMGLMELVWSFLHRRFRFGVWIALLLAGLSALTWLPLLKTMTRFNAGDTAASGYYAKPTLGKLTSAYVTLFIFDKQHILFLLTAACLCALVYAFAKNEKFKALVTGHTRSITDKHPTNLYIIGFCEIAFPVLVFAVALFVTGTFNVRYCLLACLGFSVLVGCLASHFAAFKPVAPLVLLASCPLALIAVPEWGQDAAAFQPLFARADQPYPIVVGEGLQFFQLEESAPAPTKARLVYVTAPAGLTSPDATNENQVERWGQIRPDLPIVDSASFFARNPRFYVLHTGASTDVLTDWLLRKGVLKKLIAHSGDVWLFEAGSPLSGSQ